MSSEKSMSKRQAMRAKRERQAHIQRLSILGVVIVGALLLAFALIYPNVKPIGKVVAASSRDRPMVNDNAMGDPNAPIKVEEFSDFQCPYCKQFYTETEDQIVQQYVKTGKVYFIYRSMGNFLSDNIARSGGPSDTESIDAISAAYCAGDQGKFWEYHDILFANQTGEGVGDFTPRKLTAYAQELNLDMNAFQSCFDSGKYKERAQQDEKDGQAAGVKATPSFVMYYTVNGQQQQKLIEGALPFSQFQQDFDAALAEMGAQ
jgi:protein-disulfide isomerase